MVRARAMQLALGRLGWGIVIVMLMVIRGLYFFFIYVIYFSGHNKVSKCKKVKRKKDCSNECWLESSSGTVQASVATKNLQYRISLLTEHTIPHGVVTHESCLESGSM